MILSEKCHNNNNNNNNSDNPLTSRRTDGGKNTSGSKAPVCWERHISLIVSQQQYVLKYCFPMLSRTVHFVKREARKKMQKV